MSSFTRTIQRTLIRAKRGCRHPHYMDRGSRLGITNPKDKALLARLRRESKRLAR